MSLRTLRAVLAVSLVALLIVATLHSGVLTGGLFEPAAAFEIAVAVILATGLALTYVGRDAARFGAFGAQLLALGGLGVGVYMAVRGMAPNSLFEFGYFAFAIVLLVIGLVGAVKLDTKSRSSV